MNINCKIKLKNLKGEDLMVSEGEVLTLGTALGNILSSGEEGGKMKCFILATKFASNDSVEVDTADFALIKSMTKSTKIYTALVAGQVEQMLEEFEILNKPNGETSK